MRASNLSPSRSTRPAAALASFTEALAVLRELDDRRGLAEFTLAQAEVEIELGLEQAAGEHLRTAAAWLGAGKNREQQAELARLQGAWHLLRGEDSAAREALRRAVDHATASHSVVALLDARLAAARVDPADHRAEIDRLHAQAEALGHALLRLRAAEAVAQAALAAGDTGRAQTAARTGLDAAVSCGGYSGAYRLHRVLAQALERAGRPSEAAAERDRATREIARLSRGLTPGQQRSFQRIEEDQDRGNRSENGRPAPRQDG